MPRYTPQNNDDVSHPSESYREGWEDVMQGLRPRERRRTCESITEFASYLKGVSEAQTKKKTDLPGS